MRLTDRRGRLGWCLLDCTRKRGTLVFVEVELSRTARKQLTKVPAHIVRKFALWVDLVQVEGLEVARAVPGYRDHELKGTWQGYRAVRLSDAYRVILHRADGRFCRSRARRRGKQA